MTVGASSATLGLKSFRRFWLGTAGVGVLLGQSVLSGCAGRAASEDLSSGSPSGGGSTNGAPSSGGADGAGGSYENAPPNSGGAMGVGGTETVEDPSIYQPTRTDVDYDRLLEGEAPELRQGHGWDTCYTKNPGLTFEEGGAGVGQFLAFRSGSEPTPGQDGSEDQITFFTSNYEALNEAGVPVYVYFEVRDLSDAPSPPEGELSLALAYLCESTDAAISVPLSDLKATTNWETRCVELPPQAPEVSLNMWVTGSDFAMGIDALRFGPSCH